MVLFFRKQVLGSDNKFGFYSLSYNGFTYSSFIVLLFGLEVKQVDVAVSKK
jgi:hypothetical protein